MATRRYLSKWNSFFWLVIIVAVTMSIGNRLEWLDNRLYLHAAHFLGSVPPDRTLHLLHDGQVAPPEPDVITETRHMDCPAVGVMELNAEAARNCFAALPLGAQDTAVLLNKLSGRGIRHLAYSAPFIWEGEDSAIARQMVCMRLEAFENAALGLRGRTAAEADFTPTVLRRFTIPSDCVEGDTTGLPSANKAVENHLMQAQESLKLAWAPDWLDDERLTQRGSSAGTRSYPLLVRWNGEIIPTLPLRLALMIKGYTAADIHIRIGRDIKLGNITLPLDEHGRTRLNQVNTTTLNVSDVIDGTPTAEGTLSPQILMLTQPTEYQQAEGRSELMAATISQLCAEERVTKHTEPGAPGLSLMYRNPAEGPISLGVLALAALFTVRLLPFLYSPLRKLIMLAAFGAIIWWAYKMMIGGEWFHVSAALVTWLTAAIALSFLRPGSTRSVRKR
ncbi:MAG: hypothetical protein IKJ58_02975 [Akkermansia sp.]|nr:hypothetical protein [Akkermansia sp.]